MAKEHAHCLRAQDRKQEILNNLENLSWEASHHCLDRRLSLGQVLFLPLLPRDLHFHPSVLAAWSSTVTKEPDPKLYFRPRDALHFTKMNVTRKTTNSAHTGEFSTGPQRISHTHMNCRKPSEGMVYNF